MQINEDEQNKEGRFWLYLFLKYYSETNAWEEATKIYFGNGEQTKIFIPSDFQTKKEANYNLALY